MVSLDPCGGPVRRGWATAFPFWGCGNGRSGAPNQPTPTRQSGSDSRDARRLLGRPAPCCSLALFLTPRSQLSSPHWLLTWVRNERAACQAPGDTRGRWRGLYAPGAHLPVAGADTCTADRVTEPVMINTKSAHRRQRALSGPMRKWGV